MVGFLASGAYSKMFVFRQGLVGFRTSGACSTMLAFVRDWLASGPLGPAQKECVFVSGWLAPWHLGPAHKWLLLQGIGWIPDLCGLLQSVCFLHGLVRFRAFGTCSKVNTFFVRDWLVPGPFGIQGLIGFGAFGARSKRIAFVIDRLVSGPLGCLFRSVCFRQGVVGFLAFGACSKMFSLGLSFTCMLSLGCNCIRMLTLVSLLFTSMLSVVSISHGCAFWVQISFERLAWV